MTAGDVPATAQQLRGEVAMTRRRIGIGVNAIERDVVERAGTLARALPYALLTGVAGGSVLLAVRRAVARIARS